MIAHESGVNALQCGASIYWNGEGKKNKAFHLFPVSLMFLAIDECIFCPLLVYSGWLMVGRVCKNRDFVQIRNGSSAILCILCICRSRNL